ncbi:S8 family serine peptidase [Dongia sp. agr-C8]
MRGAPTVTMRLGLLLIAAAALWLSAGIAEAQPRTGGSTPGTAPRLPTTPLIGDELPGLPGGAPGVQPNGNAPHAPDLLVAVFRPDTPDETPNAFAESLNLQIERSYEMAGLRLRVFLLRIPAGGNADTILQQANNDRRPLWVQFDFAHRTMDGANAAASQQYALAKIRADSLPQAARGQGVSVALIDSGVALEHESLNRDNITAIDLVDEKKTPPGETHGTVVASIIAGSGKVKGLAPAAEIIAIRAFSEIDPKSGASTSDSYHVSQAISVALEKKARIINMSIGGPNDPLVRMVVQQAVLTGVVVIAAAGNSGPDAPPCYPAAQRGVIAVTATDDKDRLFSGANRGDYVAVAAPGVAVIAAKPGKGGGSAYDYFTGTSMATGYATGLAAVLLSADPKLTSIDIRRIMESSATDLGAPKKDPEFGWGRIDAAAAFSSTPKIGAAN